MVDGGIHVAPLLIPSNDDDAKLSGSAIVCLACGFHKTFHRGKRFRFNISLQCT